MLRRPSCLLAVMLMGLAAGQFASAAQSDEEKPAALALRDMQGKKRSEERRVGKEC